MAKKIKMADIAKEFGISVVTVSKALSGQKGVSEELRVKIKQYALDMGYKKTSFAEVAEHESHNIGVIVPSGYMVKYETFYWEMYQAILVSAGSYNSFVILETLSPEDEAAMIPPKLLKENKVNAVIILGGLNNNYLKMLKEHYSYPTVYLDFYSPTIKEDSVISNSFYGSYQATNYLFEMGHKNIGFLGTILSTNSITDRYLGYVKSLSEHGKQIREDWILPDRDDNRICYDEIPLPKEMPTAFFCNCDMMASKLIKSLNKAGYKVPEDVSVVGFDDFLYPGLCNIPLTTYSVNMQGMAESAIKLIIKKLENKETSMGMHMIEGHFVERNSVKTLK